MRSSKKSRKLSNRNARLIDDLLKEVAGKLKGNLNKATVADLIRLMELQKDVEEEQPREITVQWVEPSEEEHVSEE